jgi:RNA polymerase sigma-70 factor (ECF subfamily)
MKLVTGLTGSASHSYALALAVAGLVFELQLRLIPPKLESKEYWLVSMSALSNDDEQDTPQIQARVKEAQSGSSFAYGLIVERYQQAIGIQMRRFSRDFRTCEELTHDVFVEAYTSLHTYRFKSPFLHWLRRIAVRVGYRYWKNKSRESKVVSISDTQIHEMESHSTDTQNSLEAAETVHRLLSQLPAPDRLVLTVIYLDGCTIKEAAYRCRWTIAGTKLRLFRARRKVINLLDNYHHE